MPVHAPYPLLIAGNVLLASAASTCLKLSTTMAEGDADRLFVFLLAILLNASSFVVLTFVLTAGGLAASQAMISSSVMVMSVVVGRLCFAEKLNLYQWASVALAMAAIGMAYTGRVVSVKAAPSTGTALVDSAPNTAADFF